jgi:lipopolysaccharide biosynthesis glycosyltransferase
MTDVRFEEIGIMGHFIVCNNELPHIYLYLESNLPSDLRFILRGYQKSRTDNAIYIPPFPTVNFHAYSLPLFFVSRLSVAFQIESNPSCHTLHPSRPPNEVSPNHTPVPTQPQPKVQHPCANLKLTPTTVWASLITNLSYLPGLLTLHHSLNNPAPDPSLTTNTNAAQGTKYPFIAFYTSTFPASGLEILKARGIPAKPVPSITPSITRKYAQDPRFAETWNKLVVFSLEEYERVVLLDGDILVRRNMDELMEMPLDERDHLDHVNGNGLSNGEGQVRRVFAAAHACACNPMKKEHYPENWYVLNMSSLAITSLYTLCMAPYILTYINRIPANCAYTTQHRTPDHAQKAAPVPGSGVGMLNSGVLVVTPSIKIYAKITTALQDTARIEQYDFPDQELLSEVFAGQWVALPYVYNALKTLRMEGVHDAIWRDEEVKAVHYIFGTKPWHENVSLGDVSGLDELNAWWWRANWARESLERGDGIRDEFSGSG